jgi:hypothetical protein
VTNTEITVFIPTLATAERARHLRKALDSVRAQRQAEARIVVIVNGDAFDPDLLHELERNTEVGVLRRPVADFPASLRAGRAVVESPFFAELDDDDELLPDALARVSA